MTTRPDKLPTPSTAQFGQYIKTVAKPALYAAHSRAVASQLLNLLYYLEHERYDFSKDRAYQTRPICINELAEYFEVTHRSVQRWLAALEDLGILVREYRKDPSSRFKNKFSRVAFPSFKAWFGGVLQAARDALCHPPKKDNLQLSINDKNSDEKKSDTETPPFPASGGISYESYWIKLAHQHLPSVRRPCPSMIADKFRKHLKDINVPLNHRSIRQRWINFCSKAKPIGY